MTNNTNAHAHTHTHGRLNDIHHADKRACCRSDRTKRDVKLYMRLIRVGSACSSSHTVMLRGPLHSVVDLTMVSKSTGNAWSPRTASTLRSCRACATTCRVRWVLCVQVPAVKEVMPYLLRRLEENSDTMGAVGKQRLMIWTELKRRLLAPVLGV